MHEPGWCSRYSDQRLTAWSRDGKFFSSLKRPRQLLGYTQPLFYGQMDFVPEIKPLRCGVDYWISSSFKVTNAWRENSSPPVCLQFVQGKINFFLNSLYRVSINSFPDYKHLLQENYVEYKHIFLQNVTQLKKFFTTHWCTSTCALWCTENV